MTQDEARREILAEWRKWRKADNLTAPTGTDGLVFFGWLRNNRPDLLSFKASGDKWQRVHAWLRGAGELKDL